MKPSRAKSRTAKVKTPFGSIYVHVDFTPEGYILGGSISDPQKEPDAEVARFVQALSTGLDQCLIDIGKYQKEIGEVKRGKKKK